MKKYLVYPLTLLICILSTGCEKDNGPDGYSVPEKVIQPLNLTSAKATDIALAWYGGIQRPEWNESEITPYLTYTDPDTHEENWAFDGIVFLESNNGKDYGFASPVIPTKEKASRRIEWEELINRNFESGKAVDAFDKAVGKCIARLGVPKRTRKVILMLPEPWPNQKDWGFIEGEKMDFSKESHRVKAIRWYIDQLLAKWAELNPENIELAGFYWVPETATNAQNILAMVKAYISLKGNYFFYWMPHWGSFGNNTWSKFGFDFAFQQPNVFFNEEPAYKVDQVVDFAKKHGLSLQLEFDEGMMDHYNRPWARRNFMEYMDSFSKNGIFENYPLAYYQNHFAWSNLIASDNEKDQELAKKLGRIIVARQKAADALVK